MAQADGGDRLRGGQIDLTKEAAGASTAACPTEVFLVQDGPAPLQGKGSPSSKKTSGKKKKKDKKEKKTKKKDKKKKKKKKKSSSSSSSSSSSIAESGEAAAKKRKMSKEIRQVRLPAGWEGLSIKQDVIGRIIVSEVPKACFSSAAFGTSVAKPQVEGVFEGDEVVQLNGEEPEKAIARITTEGDPWNACSSAKPPHAVGSKGKLDSPPCVACDFLRRRKAMGLAMALQMWLRAVKRDFQITLGVRSAAPIPKGFTRLLSETLPAAVQASSASVVDLAASSSVGGSISELKSLEFHRAARGWSGAERR